MSSRILAFAALTCTAFLGSVVQAGVTTPGSLIVFPVFDNRYQANGQRNLTLLTVTNTNREDDVEVHFVYRNAPTCLETNRSHTLTPNDTLSVITAFHNPNRDEGYCYVYAQNPSTHHPIKFDWLIASQMDLRADDNDARDANFEFTPFIFRASNRLTPGARTDTVDNDNLRDLNGAEYEKTPDALLIPRFFGQDAQNTAETLGDSRPRFFSELVLINLTGGRLFDATVDFLIYNDNEEVFSAQSTFRCWVRKSLTDINGVFTNDFLRDNTDQDDSEVNGAGDDFPETGWFSIDGNIADSTATSLSDPALLALLISNDHTEDKCGGAVIPFCLGTQCNGDLLSLSLNGDTSIPLDDQTNTDPWNP